MTLISHVQELQLIWKKRTVKTLSIETKEEKPEKDLPKKLGLQIVSLKF